MEIYPYSLFCFGDGNCPKSDRKQQIRGIKEVAEWAQQEAERSEDLWRVRAVCECSEQVWLMSLKMVMYIKKWIWVSYKIIALYHLVLFRLSLAEEYAKPLFWMGTTFYTDTPVLHESPQSLCTQKSSLPIGDDPNLRMVWTWTSTFVCQAHTHNTVYLYIYKIISTYHYIPIL